MRTNLVLTVVAFPEQGSKSSQPELRFPPQLLPSPLPLGTGEELLSAASLRPRGGGAGSG